MDWRSVRQAVVQEFLRLDGASSALSNDLIDRAICQALADLRPLAFWFNTADLALDLVVDQQSYGRNFYAQTDANKLPYGFWRPVGDKLMLDHEKEGLSLYDIHERHPEQWDRIDRQYRNSSRPECWTLKERDLYLTPAPDSIDQVQGRYVVDLGTPMAQYRNSAWRYVMPQVGGGHVGITHECIANAAAVFTDYSDEINNATANDVPLGSTAGDAIYFGYDWFPDGEIKITVGTPGVGSYVVTWEYWNGSAWTALAGITDGTSSFKNAAGTYGVTFTVPVDSVKRFVSGAVFKERRHWIRAVSDGAGASTDPLLNSATSINDIAIETFSNAWFTEPAAFDVLVCRAGLQYFARYQRDNEQRERASAALAGAMNTLRATQGSIATLGEIEPWMGDQRGGVEHYYSDD